MLLSFCNCTAGEWNLIFERPINTFSIDSLRLSDRMVYGVSGEVYLASARCLPPLLDGLKNLSLRPSPELSFYRAAIRRVLISTCERGNY